MYELPKGWKNINGRYFKRIVDGYCVKADIMQTRDGIDEWAWNLCRYYYEGTGSVVNGSFKSESLKINPDTLDIINKEVLNKVLSRALIECKKFLNYLSASI
jgi:hypothetical protein